MTSISVDASMRFMAFNKTARESLRVENAPLREHFSKFQRVEQRPLEECLYTKTMQNLGFIVLLLVIAASLYTLYTRLSSLEAFATGIHEALMRSVSVIEDEYVSHESLKEIVPSILRKAAKFAMSNDIKIEQRLLSEGSVKNSKITDKRVSDRTPDMDCWKEGDEACYSSERPTMKGVSSEDCSLDKCRNFRESYRNDKEVREREDCEDEEDEGEEDREIEGMADVLSSVASIFGSLGGKHQHDVHLRAADINSARVYVAAPPAFISARGGLTAALDVSSGIFFDDAHSEGPTRMMPHSATIEEMDSDEDCEAA